MGKVKYTPEGLDILLQAWQKTNRKREEATHKLMTDKAFVACKSCKSTLRVKYMNATFCPLCGNDLRSKKQKELIERLNKENTEAYTKFEEYDTKLKKALDRRNRA